VSELLDLPPDWCYANFEEVARSVGGGTPSKSDPTFWTNGTIPWVSPKDMKTFNVTSSEDTLTEKALNRLSLIPSESVLVVVRSGILSRTLPVALNRLPVTINQDMRAFLPEHGVSGKYLAWQLMAREREVLSKCSKDGTTVASIEGPAFARFPLAIAPTAQQTRIVAKLEELLSELDAGVAELKAAQKKLKQYRQSLLKAAVEGSLTVEWRAKNTPAETGAQLLERILAERRALWEAKQLAKFKEQGKTPPKDWQKKYPEPVQPDTTDLPKLPEGWVWATLSQVGWLDRGRSKHRPRNAPHLYGGAYPFVQTGDIRHADTFLAGVEATYSEAGLAQSRLWPAGTMCITIAANIGKTTILSMEACFPDSVVGFLSGSDDISIRYVEYFMRSVQQKLEDEAPATAQKNINLEILEKVAIPVPPALEQDQIVKLLDDFMGGAKENELAIELSLKQSAAQRQNILRAAFAGKLIPQDPNDEPASMLLARIRAERAKGDAVKILRGRRKRIET
jgi:type I restriction enzyme S subunit